MASLHITLVKSAANALPNQRKTVQALGLKKLHQTVVKVDTPTIRGMLNVVQHLIDVEEGS
jgi:large subunit ribosomal protein L30